MLELFQESLVPVNLPFTLLLAGIALYWIIGLIGLIDIEGPDGVDVDIDLDGGGPKGGDPDGVEGADRIEDSGSNAFGGFYQTLLNLVGASDAPLMFVISLFSVFLWGSNVLVNHYFNPEFETGRATLLLLPVVIGSFVLTRLLVRPLRPLMKLLRTSEKPLPILGAGGKVRSSSLDSEFGEVEVETSDRTLILRARISANGTPLQKGDPILVVSRDDESETYVVRALDQSPQPDPKPANP